MAHVLTPTRIEEWLNNTFRTAAMVHGLDLVFPVEDYRIEVDADIDARIFGIHVRCPDGIKTLPRILREAEDAEKAFCEANPHTPFDLSARP